MPFVLTPNDLINTRGRASPVAHVDGHGFGHVPRAGGLRGVVRSSGISRVSPSDSTISAAMNFGVIRVLAEPIGTRRMDNVTLLDVRLERETCDDPGLVA